MRVPNKNRFDLDVISPDMRKELLRSAQEAWANYLKAGIRVLPCKECSGIIPRHHKNFHQDVSAAPVNEMEIELGLLKTSLSETTPKIIATQLSDARFRDLVFTLGEPSGGLVELRFPSEPNCRRFIKLFASITGKSLQYSNSFSFYFRKEGIKNTIVHSDPQTPAAALCSKGFRPMPLAPSSLTYSTEPVFIHDFSDEEIETLMSIVMSFGKVQYALEEATGSETESRVNTCLTIESILKRYNWCQIPCADDSITYWSETGNSNAIAGCIQTTEGNNVFTYLGNMNTFCAGKSYTPFQVYTYLAHNRDQSSAVNAAQSLLENNAPEGRIELELDENQINGVPMDSSNITYLDASEWLGRKIASPQPIIKDLLDFKDKCLLIGQAKTRKSFLALQLSYERNLLQKIEFLCISLYSLTIRILTGRRIGQRGDATRAPSGSKTGSIAPPEAHSDLVEATVRSPSFFSRAWPKAINPDAKRRTSSPHPSTTRELSRP